MPGANLEPRLIFVGPRPPHCTPPKFFRLLYSQWKANLQNQEHYNFPLYGLILSISHLSVCDIKQEVRINFDWNCLHTQEELGIAFSEYSSATRNSHITESIEIFTEHEINYKSLSTSWIYPPLFEDINYKLVVSVSNVDYLDESLNSEQVRLETV